MDHLPLCTDEGDRVVAGAPENPLRCSSSKHVLARSLLGLTQCCLISSSSRVFLTTCSRYAWSLFASCLASRHLTRVQVTNNVLSRMCQIWPQQQLQCQAPSHVALGCCGSNIEVFGATWCRHCGYCHQLNIVGIWRTLLLLPCYGAMGCGVADHLCQA